jgi:hypothetical protein
MAHLGVTDAAVRSAWGGRLVLVRPDQHIAWRTDGTPSDWDVVLDVVTGHRRQDRLEPGPGDAHQPNDGEATSPVHCR